MTLAAVCSSSSCTGFPVRPEGSASPASIEATSLPGGTRIITVDTAVGDSLVVALVVPAGSAQDPAGRRGLAHLVEHLVMGGDRDPGELEAAAALIAKGGWRQAYTFDDYTVYAELVPTADLDASLRRHRARLDRFAPTPEMLETSRRVVLRELDLRRMDPRPEERLLTELRRVLLEGSSYAIDGLGRREEILSIDLEHVEDFFERHYPSSAPVVLVAGALPHSRVEAAADPVFRDLVAPARPAAPVLADVQTPAGFSQSLEALTAFPLRISGTAVARPSAEARIDLAATRWAMCGRRSSALSQISGLSGIRRAGCGLLEFREAAVFYVFMESYGREVREDGWRRVLAALSRLPAAPLAPDAFDGFMALERGPDGWAALGPWDRLLRVASGEVLVGAWERRIRPGDPPRDLPARVQATASALLQPAESWPVIDCLPAQADLARPSEPAALPED